MRARTKYEEPSSPLYYVVVVADSHLFFVPPYIKTNSIVVEGLGEGAENLSNNLVFYDSLAPQDVSDTSDY